MSKVESNSKDLNKLLLDHEYGRIYKEILKFCIEPKTKDEIEKFVIESLKATYEKVKVWPAHFIWKLEKAGGLFWEGKWKTTEVGLKAVK